MGIKPGAWVNRSVIFSTVSSRLVSCDGPTEAATPNPLVVEAEVAFFSFVQSKLAAVAPVVASTPTSPV